MRKGIKAKGCKPELEKCYLWGFFLDHKTPKITTMYKTCDSDGFVSLLCIETKTCGVTQRDIFLALRYREVENIKKAKIKSEMEQRNWLEQHKCSLMLQLVKKIHRVSWEKINGNLEWQQYQALENIRFQYTLKFTLELPSMSPDFLIFEGHRFFSANMTAPDKLADFIA